MSSVQCVLIVGESVVESECAVGKQACRGIVVYKLVSCESRARSTYGYLKFVVGTPSGLSAIERGAGLLCSLDCYSIREGRFVVVVARK